MVLSDLSASGSKPRPLRLDRIRIFRRYLVVVVRTSRAVLALPEEIKYSHLAVLAVLAAVNAQHSAKIVNAAEGSVDSRVFPDVFIGIVIFRLLCAGFHGVLLAVLRSVAAKRRKNGKNHYKSQSYSYKSPFHDRDVLSVFIPGHAVRGAYISTV